MWLWHAVDDGSANSRGSNRNVQRKGSSRLTPPSTTTSTLRIAISNLPSTGSSRNQTYIGTEPKAVGTAPAAPVPREAARSGTARAPCAAGARGSSLDPRLLDAGNDLELAAAAGAALDLDAEHALQAPCPAHRHMSGRRWRGRIRGRPLRRTPAPLRGRHRRAPPAVRANTPWNLVIGIRGGGTSAASRAIRSGGSSTMCVVPSRHGVLSA
jgi:hypothetical protein